MIELFAAVTRQPLAAAVAQLIVEEVLHFNEELEQNLYLSGRERNRRLIDGWKLGSRWTEEDIPSSIDGVLQTLHCHQHQVDRKRMAAVFGIFKSDELKEMAEEYSPDGRRTIADRIAASIKKYYVIGIPCWQDSNLAGLWLIHPRAIDQGYVYLPLTDVDSSVGLGHLVRGTDDDLIVTNDPRVALRYTLRQMWDGSAISRVVPFVCPGFCKEVRVLDTGAKNVTYFPVDLINAPKWLLAALQTIGSSMVTSWKLKESPLDQFPSGTAAAMVRSLKNLAMPSHQAVGSFLLSRPLAESGQITTRLELSTSDQNLIRSFFTGEDGATLDRLFDATARPKQIDYNGKRIVETKKGWTCKELLLSNTVIRIEKTETDRHSKKTTVMGSLSVDGKSWHFREDLAVLQKDMHGWLTTSVLANLNVWAHLEQSWAKHLLNIAFLFSKDTAVILASDKPFGWEANVLRFPRFSVDVSGVHRVACSVFGPNVVPPPEPTVNEFDALGDLGFCQMSLALLGNLMRTQAGLHGFGIVVPSSPHVVARVGDALGLETLKNPSIQTVMANENRPLPLVGAWDDPSMNALLKIAGPKHVLTTLDTRSFKLLAPLPDWLPLPISNLSTYSELLWIYHAVPRLLKEPPALVDGHFFEGLAKVLHPWLTMHNPRHKVMKAAHLLDDLLVNASMKSTGNRWVMLMARLAHDGVLRVESSGDSVRIKHQDLIAALASPVLPPFDLSAITKALIASDALHRASPTVLHLKGNLWGLISSYILTI